jgi:hypothetical protein
MFTEIGYRSIGGAHTRPWDYQFQSYFDDTEQANDYEALFSYWNDYPWMMGIHIWDWQSDPNAGWPGNTDYTPQHKKAEEVIKRWFGGSVNPNPTPSKVSFNLESARVSPANPTKNQNLTITAAIKNTADASSNIIVDLEIYDQNGNRVLQKFFEGQSFIANEIKNYNVDWTPSNNGSYTLKVGVFSNRWTTNYLWNGNALTFTVGNSTPSPSPTPTVSPTPSPTNNPTPTPVVGGSYETDIWWPTNGSRVSGIQPFKAMLKNLAVSAYEMFWQVDGDRLNTMPTNEQDYPHKETLVDLSGWNWKNEGPYNINFVSKDFGGNLLSQRSIDLYITR